ncbi:cellulase family glycosylhydrolase [Actinophytocola sp.]|uniref:cellulase family glycosylhydrolase n=1 Tax=Actinophytocola sp. TaxID=1872138 RepID=UPI002D4E871B|nr:cellulase family glycosylhydrolase [Actinophytocola sp.]HYQ66482.1 cellulase family glycosylhydrolase [Actinophytocola sp.]
MPDAQYAGQFWTGVANAFKGNDAVVFDLFNEPFPDIPAGNVGVGWTCFRDGGTCPGIGHQVAGFQSLVDAVRPTGVTTPAAVRPRSRPGGSLLSRLVPHPRGRFGTGPAGAGPCRRQTVAQSVPFSLNATGWTLGPW